MFIPTTRALEKKDCATLETLDQSHVDLLHELDRRMTGLESALKQGLPDAEEMIEFRQVMGIARVVVMEWRQMQGLSGSPSPPGGRADGST